MRVDRLLLPLLLSVVPMSGVLAAGDIPQGPYLGSCGDRFHCEAEMLKTDLGYDLKLRVADSVDSARVVCTFNMELKAFSYDVAATDDQSIKVIHLRTGDLVVSGLPDGGCPGAKVNGSFVDQRGR